MVLCHQKLRHGPRQIILESVWESPVTGTIENRSHKAHEPRAKGSRVFQILLLQRQGLENGAFPPTLPHTREHSVGSRSVPRGRVRYRYCSKQAR